MQLYEELRQRGMIDNSTSPVVESLLNEKKICFYIGFDPTAESLHVGHLASFNIMRILQKQGHKALAVIGGATGMIGDPGGKSKERNLLTKEALFYNVEKLGEQMHFLLRETQGEVTVLNNYDWLSSLSYIDFLRDIGKLFSVNNLITRDSVQQRIGREGSGISYTEFSYALLQAYDFYHLCKTEDCVLQVGGSDQWGNLVSGIDLTRRLLQKEVFGMTFPLLTKSDGVKFGKSETNTIWLHSSKTNAYDFYQFFIQQSDTDVIHLLKTLTDISLEEIEKLDLCCENKPEKRYAQVKLAQEITRFVHGEEKLAEVEKATQFLFGGTCDKLSDNMLEAIFKEAPKLEKEESAFDEGLGLIDAFYESGLCASKSQARQLITSGGAYINNQKQQDIQLVLTKEHKLSENFILLRSGKKKYAVIKIISKK